MRGSRDRVVYPPWKLFFKAMNIPIRMPITVPMSAFNQPLHLGVAIADKDTNYCHDPKPVLCFHGSMLSALLSDERVFSVGSSSKNSRKNRAVRRPDIQMNILDTLAVSVR